MTLGESQPLYTPPVGICRRCGRPVVRGVRGTMRAEPHRCGPSVVHWAMTVLILVYVGVAAVLSRGS